MTSAVRDELSGRFPPADVPILGSLACRRDQLRVASGLVHADVPDSATTAQVMAFACAPGGWSAALSAESCPGLSLTVSPTSNCGTATLQADLAQTGVGVLGQITFQAPGLLGSPQTLPISLALVHDLLHDGGFEQPFEPSWAEVSFLPSAAFALDDQAPHAGHGALRIDAPEANDARVVQTVSVQPHTRYRLSGWIRTEGVTEGAGANLTVEWPGQGWNVTRGVSGTSGWTFVAIDVDSGSLTSFEVQARLGHYGAISRGHAWFDDLRLEMIP
jgi:hypothetical protein